jgi:hypothetical protein
MVLSGASSYVDCQIFRLHTHPFRIPTKLIQIPGHTNIVKDISGLRHFVLSGKLLHGNRSIKRALNISVISSFL